MRQKIRAAVHKNEDFLTFDFRLEVGVEAETLLCPNAEYNKAFKSTPKGQAAEKASKNNGKGKAHHNSNEDCSS
jgi:hypothetical protein